MAVWAVGDIQGCYDSLRKLLKKIKFKPKEDTLWLVGDLVNRGDKSLEVLEYLYSIDKSTKIVLGNHDISLIASYYGIKRSNPTIEPILKSKKAKKLINWLRHKPFVVWDKKLNCIMSHAGISPQFDLKMAIKYASTIEKRLQSSNAKSWLSSMFKRSPNFFNKNLSELDRERYILSSFTRMRFCDNSGKLDFYQKGKPTNSKMDKGLKPWFKCPNRRSIKQKIIFGHWSTLGYFYNGEVLCLDSGCLWGRELTGVRLDTKKVKAVQVKCGKS